MNFKDALYNLSEKVINHKQECKTEEATKTALILPFISALGYDTFNPREVVPEVDCAIRNTGDKVDYVIMADGFHQILIECKHWEKGLDNYVSQLASYYAASVARFGILTNGVEYRFYTDLNRANLMDEDPFLIVDMEKLDNRAMDDLKMFCKNEFDERRILDRAAFLKHKKQLDKFVWQELSSPSSDLVRHFAKLVYGYTPSSKERELFTELLKQSIHEYTMCAQITGNLNDAQSCFNHKQSNSQGIANGDMQQVLDLVRSIVSDIVQPNRITVYMGNVYSTFRLDGSQWLPIIKYKALDDNSAWFAVGMYNPTTCHFLCDHVNNKIYIDEPADVITYTKNIRDIVTVMLMVDDDERVKWVQNHRPDWNNLTH